MFVVLKRLHFWVYLLLVTSGCTDCSEKQRSLNYGQLYSLKLSKNAYFLEFSHMGGLAVPNLVLWDRTDPGVGQRDRGRVQGTHWVIDSVTQRDQGHYTALNRNKRLIDRYTLFVSAWEQYHNKMVGEDFVLEFNLSISGSHLVFETYGYRSMDLMWDGRMLSETPLWRPDDDELWHDEDERPEGRLFEGRIWQQKLPSEPGVCLLIGDLREYEFGTFSLYDKDGNLALEVQLNVYRATPDHLALYIGIAVGAVCMVVVVICCCVKKCCCKKSSSKRDTAAPETAAAPAVYYHDNTCHFSGPSYTSPLVHFQQPSGPTYPSQSASALQDPLVPAAPSLSLGAYCLSSDPEPQFETKRRAFPSASLGSGCLSSDPEPQFELKGPAFPSASLGSGCLSSDPDPQFELKGPAFPSAPPLSSDSTIPQTSSTSSSEED